MFVENHAIETDFANQTTAAAIVTVPTSKPIKAIIGNSTGPIALLRDGRHHGYKMLIACASCDWRNRGKMVADAVPVEPVSTLKFPANWEINREFFKIGLGRGLDVAIRQMIPWT
jgi:hypothetical protein